MPAAIAIPLITAAATAGTTAYSQYSQNQQADAQRKQQQGLIDQQTDLGKTLGGYAKNNYELSQPALQKAIQYYTTLASGSRSAINQANAPQIAQIQDTYKGAEKNLPYHMRGGAKDYAQGELERNKAGALSLLPINSRLAGASQLASIGQSGVGASMNGLSGAAGIASGAFNGQVGIANTQNAQYDAQRQQWMNFGKQVGDIFLPYLTQKKGSAGSAPAGPFGR